MTPHTQAEPPNSKGSESETFKPPAFVGRVEQIQLNYREKLAELIQDRHSHGITTEQLSRLDAEARAQLLAAFAAHVQTCKPKRESGSDIGMYSMALADFERRLLESLTESESLQE